MDINNTLQSIPATVYSITETDNSAILRGRVRIFYRGVNRNGSIINDVVAQQLIDSLTYVPVKGNYSADDKDFGGHDGPEGERVYGLVPSKEDRNFAWEEHEDEDGILRNYACSDILIWKMYDEAEDILGKSQSMELNPNTMDGHWVYKNGAHYFEFTSASFLGLQVLGDDVEPCFEGSSFFEKAEDYEVLMAYTLSRLLKDLDMNQIITLGGMNMKDKVNMAAFNNAAEDDDKIKVEEELPVVAMKDTSDEAKLEERTNDVDDKEAPDEDESTVQGEDGKTDKEDIHEAEEGVATEEEEEAEEVDIEVEAESDVEPADPTYSKNEIEENNAKIVELEEQISTYEREIEELRQFKANIELNERKAVLGSYKEHIGDELFADYEARLSEYTTIESLEKDLAYDIIKQNKDFAKQGERIVIPNNDSATDSNAEVTSVLDAYKK